jgi:hypothetical protein
MLQTDFVIAANYRVPGLGVLVLPADPAPGWLADHALHTALSVTLLIDGQPPSLLNGTVEELSRNDQIPQRAFLLDFAPDDDLPLGTRLRIMES